MVHERMMKPKLRDMINISKLFQNKGQRARVKEYRAKLWSYWVNCIQEAAAEDVSVLLLGNKSDDEQRQVKTEEGDNLAKEYNFAFMECSAATGQNVIESLETMARMLSQSADFREKTTQLHKQPAQKKQSSCC
uniref:RAB44, member RAS oncogene family n=1 Tax=Nothobranchius rachovii TaxID=451742 RepID=A0A1A8RHR0_9TELE